MSTQEHAVANVHRDDIRTRMGMWLFLFTELLLFGGLFFAYTVYRHLYSSEFVVAGNEMHVIIGAMNTAILLTSSMTMALSIVAIQKGNKNLSILYQLVTIAFGILFLVNKYVEWTAEISAGNYPGSTALDAKGHGQIIFYGLYYTMTGLHALHVIVGMTIIAVMCAFTVKDVINKDDYVKLETAGLYWHLVDIIWIFLFPLFYLIN
ncbi:MAG: cytochrome c oxidase subunit 3 [Ignavibacteriaceae bacterium]